CSRISWSQAQAGDLAFLSDLSHVGIIAGKDTSGNILVIHCSSSANNVVITTNSIFGFAARPSCY
ncbi:MAG: peptidoglycan endopeptidase, partial [Candidatus Gastranaerophilaceae bacterium]